MPRVRHQLGVLSSGGNITFAQREFTRPTNVLFDVDGTLTDASSRVLPENIRALQQLHAAGIPITLATGRIIAGAADILAEAGVPGWVVAEGGSIVWDGHTVVRRHPLGAAAYARAVRFAEEHRLGMVVNGEEGVVVQSFGAPLFEDVICNASAGREPLRGDVAALAADTITKLSFSGTETQLDRLQELWQAAFPGAVRGHAHFVDVVAPGVTKWEGIELALGARGLEAEHTLGVGDSANDIPWMREIALSYAMPQASAETQAAARWILPAGPAPVADLVAAVLR
ncbi:HAD family hydrolase [Actinotignum sanguinis]|uniref:HAD family hydrolase n=1 Tax=Actinotignum sanguinis TaxID=1445614 RepID=A0ABT5V6G2_9ACTO|nr:HAD family hydrolase [Actinotignum sanguinis]MDE1655577.1 HAD family hydrolase [Actinotignum sanguinis]